MRIQLNKNSATSERPDFGAEDYVRQYNKNQPELGQLRAGGEVWCRAAVCFCQNCGTEVFARWRSYKDYCIEHVYHKRFDDTEEARRINAAYEDHLKSCKKEREQLENSGAFDTCPICGSDFYASEEHNLDSEWRVTVDLCFSLIHDKYIRAVRESAKKQAASFVETTNLQCIPLTVSNTEKAVAIKSDVEQLKAYLLNLILLETNIISLPKQLEKLYHQRVQIQSKIRFRNAAPLVERYPQLEEAYQTSLDCLSRCKATTPNPQFPAEPQIPSVPVYQKPGLFNKKKVNAENDALRAKYDAQMQEYNAEMELYRQSVDRIQKEAKEQHDAAIKRAEDEVFRTKAEKENLRNMLVPVTVCPEKAAEQLVQKEIEEVENLYRQLCQTRCNLYGMNIIFGKYRDLVALSTFYEYLMAGRCTTLEGTTGAYNLYESEIRANTIISKLSDVLESLDKIQQNQYMIYSQLQQMNSTLNSLNQTMEAAYKAIVQIEANTDDMSKYMAEVSKNTEVIAHNTAATAYYSKVNAELTNALGFMVALK